MASRVALDVQAPIEMVNVADLRLDALNPRRTARDANLSQQDLLIELYRRFDLDDLIGSLSVNGYFSEEPLIAIPEDEKTGEGPPFIVVEGNRRLAVLKILLFKKERDAVKSKLIPTVTEDVRFRLDPVPVKAYAKRADVHAYLGVRHIAGVKPWEALAKAKYIRSLVEQGLTFAEVARRTGTGKRTDVVRRWLLTLYAIEQANEEANQPWDELDEHFGFSWLYTSLGYNSVRKYLGITNEAFLEPKQAPVPPESVKSLLNHMRDLYGAPGRAREAAVQESRQIRELAEIYSSPEAIGALRSGVSLEVASRKTVSEGTQIVDLLRKANYDLSEANGIAPHHAGHEEAAKFARRCLETARAIVSTLER